jgi:hypothetical protein
VAGGTRLVASELTPRYPTMQTPVQTVSANALFRLAQQHSRALALAALFVVSATQAHAQGCVIARGGGASTITGGGYLEAGHWQLNIAYRNFRSDRHFVGDDEQKQRKALHNEIINHSNFTDLTATYAWSKRLNISLTLPYSWHDRSQLANGVRIHTQAKGIGDIRISANYWLWNPDVEHRGNFSVGFGIKTPTGKNDVRDYFARPIGPSEGYVDSSIQPGDHSWGATVELQGFYQLVGNLSAYGNAFYLFNPDERIEETGWSIPDGYMARGGLDYALDAVKGLVLSAGARIEGVPGNDAFGDSLGRRRPGFAVSFEPGVTFSKGRYSATLTVPIAVHRRRSVSAGTLRAGDAAFADYTINTSVTARF